MLCALVAVLVCPAKAPASSGGGTITVNSTADTTSGSCAVTCTLRDALSLVSPSGTIAFNIGGGGAQTITLTSALTLNTAGVTIDGTTQPGYSSVSKVPLIKIDASGLPASTDALTVNAGATNAAVQGLMVVKAPRDGISSQATGAQYLSNYLGTDGSTAQANNHDGLSITANSNVVKGNLISGNALNGIDMESASGTTIQGNTVGLNAAGNSAIPNDTLHSFGAGIFGQSATSTQIGGPAAGQGNVISGNGNDGVILRQSDNSVIQGNRIGTNAAGTAAIGNTYKGINIDSSANVTIGGTAAGAGNLISGQQPSSTATGGIAVIGDLGPSTTGMVIQGNEIGTNLAGTGSIPNQGYAIQFSSNIPTVRDNTVGGTAPGAANLIANNARGVIVGAATTEQTTHNLIRANRMFANGTGPAIDLGADLLTANGSHPLPGPNDWQPKPSLASAGLHTSSTIVSGSLTAPGGKTYTLDFYSGGACATDLSSYLGSSNVAVGSGGTASFSASLPLVPAGKVISATATSPLNSTSEPSSTCATAAAASPAAALGVSLTQSPSNPVAGRPLTYSLQLSNGGPDPAPGAEAILTLPRSFSFTSASSGCAHSAGTVTCSAGTLPVGASRSWSVTVVPRQGGRLVTRAKAASDVANPAPGGASASATVAVRVPPPVLHRTVVVRPVSGRVLVQYGGRGPFLPLAGGAPIPLGSVVDVTHGRVRLTAAVDRRGHTQTADFYAGIFRVGQTGGSPAITTLTLVGPLGPCGKRAADVPSATTARGRSRSRRLWGSGRGRFRTVGRYASATVRGTIWLTQDSCAGTRVTVARGVVAVRDFPHRRTVLVRAHHSYLARRR